MPKNCPLLYGCLFCTVSFLMNVFSCPRLIMHFGHYGLFSLAFPIMLISDKTATYFVVIVLQFNVHFKISNVYLLAKKKTV